MACNSSTSLPCWYLARAAGAHLHTSESDEERQHLGYRHWGWGQHSPAVTKNCHNTGERKKIPRMMTIFLPWCYQYIVFSMLIQNFQGGFLFQVQYRQKHKSISFVDVASEHFWLDCLEAERMVVDSSVHEWEMKCTQRECLGGPSPVCLLECTHYRGLYICSVAPIVF